MKKRNNNFDLSSEEVVGEFMKAYESHSSRRHHRHSHSSDVHSESKNKHPHSSESKKKSVPVFLKVLIIIVVVLLLLAMLGAGAILIMQKRGKEAIVNKKEEVTIATIDSAVSYDDSGKTVVYNGQKYVFNENVVTAVFLGIDDRRGGVYLTDEHGTAGQSDTIMVLVYDTENGNVSVLTIPRDTMVAVDVYSASGKFARTEEMQICLSFAYGDGGKSSCENVIKSVERVLMGVPVDHYFSLRESGVDALNGAVGGVELTALETIGQFREGERVHLTGTAARYYCTQRDSSKLDSDSLRRQRQIQYIKAYAAKVISMAKDDIGVISRLYNTAKKYTVTDISLSDAVFIGTELVNDSAKINKVTSLRGEYVQGDKFAEFVIDKESTYETILEIFYNKV